jgi:hypothetical protein
MAWTAMSTFNNYLNGIMEFYEQKGVDFGGMLPKV